MPRNTQTVLYDAQGNNRTATHLSTNIILVVNGNTVGAVQSVQFTETRSVRQISEVGTDGIIDSAPNKSAEISGTCTRLRYDRMRVAEAFSRSFVHLKSQRIPFDLEIHDTFHNNDTANAIVTVIKNIWFTQFQYTYSADDFVISETASFVAEDISSVIRTSQNLVQGPGNGMANPIYLNTFEQQADRGQYRGALDAPGLLNAFLTD